MGSLTVVLVGDKSLMSSLTNETGRFTSVLWSELSCTQSDKFKREYSGVEYDDRYRACKLQLSLPEVKGESVYSSYMCKKENLTKVDHYPTSPYPTMVKRLDQDWKVYTHLPLTFPIRVKTLNLDTASTLPYEGCNYSELVRLDMGSLSDCKMVKLLSKRVPLKISELSLHTPETLRELTNILHLSHLNYLCINGDGRWRGPLRDLSSIDHLRCLADVDLRDVKVNMFELRDTVLRMNRVPGSTSTLRVNLPTDKLEVPFLVDLDVLGTSEVNKIELELGGSLYTINVVSEPKVCNPERHYNSLPNLTEGRF